MGAEYNIGARHSLAWFECCVVFLPLLDVLVDLSDHLLDVLGLEQGKGALGHGEGGLEHEQESLDHG